MAGESGPVEVNIGACQCPGTPHPAGDVVWLRAKPDLNMGLATQEALRQSGSLRGDGQAAVLSALVRYGVVAWNLRDADGAVPVTTDAVVERIGWGEAAIEVARHARELYWNAVLVPLGMTRSDSAQPTPRTDSTSANQSSGQSTPTSSGESSPSEQEAGAPSRRTGASR